MAFLLGHKARVLAGEEASTCKRIRAKHTVVRKGKGTVSVTMQGGGREMKADWLYIVSTEPRAHS